jgi:hypothetical protein
MKKTIYKNVFIVEVLSQEPIENMELVDIANEGIDGMFSIITHDKINDKPVKGIHAVRELAKHGLDTEFFGMDNNGNEIND